MLIPEPMQKPLIDAVDMAIETGEKRRSNPGSHDLAMAVLCSVMAEIAKSNASPNRTNGESQ